MHKYNYELLIFEAKKLALSDSYVSELMQIMQDIKNYEYDEFKSLIPIDPMKYDSLYEAEYEKLSKGRGDLVFLVDMNNKPEDSIGEDLSLEECKDLMNGTYKSKKTNNYRPMPRQHIKYLIERYIHYTDAKLYTCCRCGTIQKSIERVRMKGGSKYECKSTKCKSKVFLNAVLTKADLQKHKALVL